MAGRAARVTTVRPARTDRLLRTVAKLVVAAEKRMSTGLEIFGVGAITAGAGMVYVPAGFIVGGILAIGLGVLIGRTE